MALAKFTQVCLYLTQLLNDNQGAIALSRNHVHRQRCKLLDIKYHFIRDTLHNNVYTKHYLLLDMFADIMTKRPTQVKLEKNLLKGLLFGL